MKPEFLSEAEEELIEAALWYERRESGLGKRFRAEVARVISRIGEDPYLWREEPGGYRRVDCPIFPYHIAYFTREDRIIVAAVAHDRRRPGYWKERVPP